VARLGLEKTIIDPAVHARTVERLRGSGVILPTFQQLADPSTIPRSILDELDATDPDAPHPRNLFRVHWYNAGNRRDRCEVPGYLSLPESLTGTPARIFLLLGERFPMIAAHKVLAAYGCLAPRLVTGQFDPGAHRAVWPSTGNYCRGGVAISRILDCRGVAVLPEGMSRERFDWLGEWTSSPEDIIRTPGTESNVKEIYDKCAELEADERNIIFNQFCEFGNYLAHYLCTGTALAHVYEDARKSEPDLRLRAFVSATGSAGTLAAGDFLKERYGSLNVAVEALECPTLLYNGYGEHNIQGIGDKHVPLIHNVMNTDLVTAISERSTDALNVLFNHPVGREYLVGRRGIPEELARSLGSLGLSSICNLLAAIKVAKYLDLGADDLIVTVATDGAALYPSEAEKTLARHYPGGFDSISAAEVFGRDLLGVTIDHLIEPNRKDRRRIFNLGYFTWVEQQGISFDDFTARADPGFWTALAGWIPEWDRLIEEFNGAVGGAKGG
jgi:cysteine synthase A